MLGPKGSGTEAAFLAAAVRLVRGLTSPREVGCDPGTLGPCRGCYGLILWGQLRPDPSPNLKVTENLGREDCPLHSQGPRVQGRQGD